MINITIPGQPVPWKRTRGGRSRRRFNDPKYAAWKEFAGYEISLAMQRGGFKILEGPVGMIIHIYCRDRRWGDIDNYEKAVADAAQGIAFVNDRQVCEIFKRRDLDRDNPRVEVKIYDATKFNICEMIIEENKIDDERY